MNPHVIVLRPEADFKRVNALPSASLNVSYRTPDDPQLPAQMKESAILVMPAMGPKLPPALFEGATLKLVQVTGAGVDRLDEPTLKKLGIPVANVPGGSNSAVAEYAVTATSLLLRRLAWSDAEIKAGNYEKFRARMLADNLAGMDGMTVGVVGFGVIGLAVAQAFNRMGAKIAYFDPAPRDVKAAAAIGAKPLALDELLRACDVVTLHVPLLPATKGMIGEKQLALMRPGAILVNAARGGIVDEAALVTHLESGHLGGAAVDVYSTEPPARDNPLLKLEGEAAQRLLLTPHIAGVTRQASAYLFRSSWENVERVLRGEAPLNRVY
ncbi:MAG: NAD(P)-binding domain-containing protein [Betaproteobacteria bacterium]|nr:NAD(P)-binding domain-containing protein [Betaproteobacteria bacterium]